MTRDNQRQNMNKIRLPKLGRIAACVASTIAAFSASAEEPADSNSDQKTLEQVIVTAQKHEERQEDVPVALTVVNPEELAQNGQVRLLDYYDTVPGLSVQSGGFMPGQQYVTIRGLSAGMNQNATTGTVIDDVPIGTGSILENGDLTAPDLDPSDLSRIEVLKGPQGTLYGADSLGGLIKYVTVDPSTAGLTGRVEVSGVDIPVGSAGYTVRAAVNVPVSETLAIRASAFSRHDPGYIDDITSGQKNINSANVYGGRLSAMWRPSADVSLKVNALVQDNHANGSAYFDAQPGANGALQPMYGYLKMTGLPFGNPWQSQQQLYSATFNAKVAGADLVSVSGYNVNKVFSAQDEGTTYDSGFTSPVNFNVPSVLENQRDETRKLTQELRLSAPVGKWLDWLVGGFYSYEKVPAGGSYYSLISEDAVTGAPGELLERVIQAPFSMSEKALFGDITLHFTDRFNLQLGGRESWNSIKYQQTSVGPGLFDFNGVTSPYVQPTLRATGQAFTYLVTPQFKLSTDAMIYARIASGYRIGGPNTNAFLFPSYNIPAEYKPDRTVNYELGLKEDFFEHRFSIDASVYYITWHEFQLTIFDNTQYYTVNAGDAKSEGVELTVQARPVTGLTLTAQGSFDEAELTQDLPPTALAAGTYGVAGDALPYSIRWSGGLAANQDFRLSNGWTGFVGGQVTYVSSRPGEFSNQITTPTTPPRTELPSYTTLNLRTGARHDLWIFNLYVNNVADRRSVVGATPYVIATGFPLSGGYYGALIQPRTIGVSVVRNF